MNKKTFVKQNCYTCPYGVKLKKFYDNFKFIPIEIYEEIFGKEHFVEENCKSSYTFKFKSSLMELEQAKEKLNSIILEFDNKTIVIQAFHELMINAIEHGNKNDHSQTIIVKLIIARKYIILTVKDNGNGFNWAKQINKNLRLETVNESGRNLGLTIIRMLCDDIFFNNKGNKAILFFSNNLDKKVFK
ncbi:ATP-binding protein [Natranaerofaba carboxydovora]|uniref:ATP-binding protein n=1 Tax=Natranaerofaba carboxydovora TaxID=2742683 RepID=UPI001F144BDE|nr:ATP-binding protein [Natranaerofaba carboxydovora]UMZ74284.1 Histidine kinase-like ATPase domain protein [Natranaerofaba carboxydovora]